MRISTLLCAAVASCAASGRAISQTVETPVPFDSAQRLLTVTPALALRLNLAAPIWPVAGEFRDARLYRIEPPGGFVLVAARADGSFERFPLDDARVAALRAAVDAAMTVAGHPIGEVAGGASEPAGNAFARRLTLLSGVIYAPIAASLSSDPSGAGALYLVVTGGTFFASYAAAQSGQITRAQSALSANLGLATGLAGWGAGYAATGNSDRGVRAVALGSALVGTIAGASLGRKMTDAEAQGAMAGMETAAAGAWAVSSAAGASVRAAAGVAAASELIGFPLGVAYPRHARYRVTAGDVNALQTAALVGVLYGAALAGKDPGHRTLGITLGATYVAGALVADAAISRPFDLTTAEANISTIGAIAGGLIGLAVPVLAQSSENSLVFGSAAVGATLGLSAALAIAKPLPAARARLSTSDSRRARLQAQAVTPWVGGLLARRPGAYPFVRLTF